MPAQGYWTIDQLVSPVLEVGTCALDGERLRASRMYYTDARWEGDALVERPRAFREWAAAAVRAVRRTMTMLPSRDHVAPDTLLWAARDGQLNDRIRDLDMDAIRAWLRDSAPRKPRPRRGRGERR